MCYALLESLRPLAVATPRSIPLLQICSYRLAMSSASAKRQRRAFLTMRRVPTLSRAMYETLATSVGRIAALSRGSFGFVRQATGSPYLYSAGIRQPRGAAPPTC